MKSKWYRTNVVKGVLLLLVCVSVSVMFASAGFMLMVGLRIGDWRNTGSYEDTESFAEDVYHKAYQILVYDIAQSYEAENVKSSGSASMQVYGGEYEYSMEYGYSGEDSGNSSGSGSAHGPVQAEFREGNTNLTYLYVDLARKQVYTNKSAYSRYSAYESSLKEMCADGAWIRIQSALADSAANMNTKLGEWQHIVEAAVPATDYIFAVHVDTGYPIEDELASAAAFYDAYAKWLMDALHAFVVSLGLFLAGIVWLTAVGGRRSRDEELHLHGFDRWYTEIAAAAVFLIWCIGLGTFLEFAEYQDSMKAVLAWFLGFGFFTAVLFLTGYLSFVRRIRGKTLWKNSLLCRAGRILGKLLRWIKRGFLALWGLLRTAVEDMPGLAKISLFFGGLLLFQFVVNGMIFSGAPVMLIPLFLADGAVMVFALRWAAGRRELLRGLERIAGGELQYQLPEEELRGDQKAMAKYINRIREGLDAAVENSLKNERMKTELITNVSHDIKTPLTSIINYIDLLKRENLADPKVRSYLDILDEKAQKLKTLTEDVVEASKASTGNVALDMGKLDLAELIHQVMGEFEEIFRGKRLAMVAQIPEEPVTVLADGRHMWRVLENIFNNVAKYAMEGTRVYVQLESRELQAVFSLKNISEQPLNISAEELTQRFVRGDASRSTEGSGLGLSIARSLTELQGGKLELSLDGDLFKVQIIFPVMK